MHMFVLAFATLMLAFWPVPLGAQGEQCQGDFNGDGHVSVDEVVVSVNNVLNDCTAPESRFVDNGDGTITDSKTHLQWEKKSDDGEIHDKDDVYTWSTGAPSFNPDGTAFTTFLAALNSQPCFAGHCDWRLPSVAESQSLLEYGRYAPAADPIFNTGCTPECTVADCSCTTLDYYWSSTPGAELTDNAWNVDLNYGYTSLYDKTLPFYVRAVRAGA